MPLWYSDEVRKKLAEKHKVSEDEVRQCFENREGDYLEDTREEHRTDPPTHWFVEIKTAYPANPTEIDIYNRLGKWNE